MKTAICLVVCCFLLNFRFELGNATKTMYAKLKRASFYGKANEHIGRNKRCSKFWGGCKTSDDCCGPVLNCAYQWGTSFCNLSGRWEMIFCVKTKSVWSKTENNTDKIAIQSFTVPRAREWAKWASERTERRARVKRAIRSKQTSERCERTSERTSEWPSTSICILGCYRP